MESHDWNPSTGIPVTPWKRVRCCVGTAIWNPYPYLSIPMTGHPRCYPYPCHALLGYILMPDGLMMDPAEVDAITSWPMPCKVKDLQSFLGFANFYCCFIGNYSNICIPLTHLTHKTAIWNWSATCDEAFKLLKKAFTTVPILTSWLPNTLLLIETDMSDYALVVILLMHLLSGKIHPIAFHSCTFSGTDINYDVHDKELLTIFEAFKTWHHYLEGLGDPIDVVTDHKNLEYFSTTKVLTRHQVCWSEYLSAFNLIICFCPGCLGAKPDALTRQWDIYPKKGRNDYATINPHNFHPVFTQEQLDVSLRAMRTIAYSHETIIRVHHSVILDIVKLNDDIRALLHLYLAIVHLLPKSAPLTPKLPTLDLTTNAPPASTASPTHAILTPNSRYTYDSDSFVHHDGHIYIPSHGNLWLRVLQYKHNHLVSGHLGIANTTKAVLIEYYWPGVHAFVKSYCISCVICKRGKAPWHKPYGFLKPLPALLRPWDSISMDFIEQLPLSGGFTAIHCPLTLTLTHPPTKVYQPPSTTTSTVLHYLLPESPCHPPHNPLLKSRSLR